MPWLEKIIAVGAALAAAGDAAGKSSAADEPSMVIIAGYMLAGLGLFFTGLNLISRHLKQMTGRRLQEMFSRFAGKPVQAGFWGFVLGGVTQSDAAVAFLSMNLLRNRLLGLRQAMVVLAWSSVGTSLLVFFTTFPMDTLVTYLLGVTGIAYAIEGNWKLRPLVGLFFGLALIFFGLLTIEHYAGQMQDFDSFRRILGEAHAHYLAGFCAGAVLTLMSQSSSAVSVVAIVLAKSGVLQPADTLMIIYGSNVGAAGGLWLLAFRERGVGKRLVMYEVLFNVIGSVVLIPLFYLEVVGHLPLVLAGLKATGLALNQQMAVAYFLFNFICALGAMLSLEVLEKWLTRRYPEAAEDEAGRVQFLHPRATRDPVSCLGLVVDDQNRIVQRLGQYFSDLPEPARRTAAAAAVHEATESLAKDIDPYLHELIQSTLPAESSTRLARLVERQRLLESLDREYYRIVPFIIESSKAGDDFAARLREGFEATTLLVTDALVGGQLAELDLAALVTRDGGDAIRRLQQTFAESAESGRTAAEQARMLQATTGLERLVWLLHAATRNARILAGAKDDLG